MGWGEFDGPLFEYLEGLTVAVPRLVPQDRMFPAGWRPNAKRGHPREQYFTQVHAALRRERSGFHLTLAPTGGWADPLGALRQVNDIERVGSMWSRAVNHAVHWLSARTRADGLELQGFESAAFTHRADPDGTAQLHTHVVIPRFQPTPDDGWAELDSHTMAWHALGAQAVADAIFRHALTFNSALRVRFGVTEPDGVILPVDRDGNPVELGPVWVGGPEARWVTSPEYQDRQRERAKYPSAHEVLPRRPYDVALTDDAPSPEFAADATADERVRDLAAAHVSGFDHVRTLVQHPAITAATPGVPDFAAPMDAPHPTLGDLHVAPAIAMMQRLANMDDPPRDVYDARKAMLDAARDLSYYRSLGTEPRWIRGLFGAPVPEELGVRRPLVEQLKELGPDQPANGSLLKAVLEHRATWGAGRNNPPSAVLDQVKVADTLRKDHKEAQQRRKATREANRQNQQTLFD